MLSALRRVLTGELILDQDLSAQALHQLVEAPSWSGMSLTVREHEVLRLVATGKTNPAVGVMLAVSTRTAKAHVERMIARLGVANRTEAVARAISLGMLTPSSPPPTAERIGGRAARRRKTGFLLPVIKSGERLQLPVCHPERCVSRSVTIFV